MDKMIMDIELSDTDRKMMQAFRNDALIALIQRQGGSVSIPVAEVDAVGGLLLTMQASEGSFHLKVEKSN